MTPIPQAVLITSLVLSFGEAESVLCSHGSLQIQSYIVNFTDVQKGSVSEVVGFPAVTLLDQVLSTPTTI